MVASIKAGKQWTGMVKTVVKMVITTGFENVTPLIENNQVTVISVRTKPQRAEIDQTDALYRRWQMVKNSI